MRSELRPVERIGRPRHGTRGSPCGPARALLRVVRALPAVAWLTLSACQADGSAEADPARTSDDAHEGVAGAPADPGPEATQRQMTLMTQLQAIDQVLAPIRQQAMDDPQIQAREQEIVARIDAAMESITPGFAGMRTRFDSLRTEYGAAQQAADQERLQSLGGELQALQIALQETQNQALQQEEVSSAIEAFRQELFDRMRAIDSSSDSLLNRAEELVEELEAVTAPGTGGSRD